MNTNRSIQVGGALLGIVLVASVIWVIRSEGERTRQAMREAKPEPIRAVELTAEKIADQAERLIDRAARLPEQIAPAPRDDASPEGSKSPGEAAGDLLGELVRTAQEVARPKTEKDAESAPKTSPPNVGDMIGDLFGLGRDLAKSADVIGQDLLGLSQEEEQRVGRELHKLIRQVVPVLAAPSEVTRLEQLAQPILEQRKRRGINYRFLVLDTAEVNAFTHAGGYVYVSQGLLDWVQTERELQFVLAHEIAHVDLAHVTKKVTYAARAAELTGDAGAFLTQLAYSLVATGYSKEEEFEADAWAYHAVLAAGGQRAEVLAAMSRLVEHVEEHASEPQMPKGDDLPGRLLWEIENHLRTHPPPAERLQALEAISG
jgi:Zn-dependent protease with chaperone function